MKHNFIKGELRNGDIGRTLTSFYSLAWEWFRKIGSNRQLDLKSVARKHSPNNSSPLRFLTSCSHLYIKKRHAIYH